MKYLKDEFLLTQYHIMYIIHTQYNIYVKYMSNNL